MNISEEQKGQLASQIEKLTCVQKLIPNGYRAIVRIERISHRRDPATNGNKPAQNQKRLLETPLLIVYRDPTLGVRLQDRTKYEGHIESVVNHPPNNIDDEIVTLGGFAKNLERLRTRLGDMPHRHLRLWFDRLGIPYQQKPTVSYAKVED